MLYVQYAAVNYRRSILDLMSESKTKKMRAKSAKAEQELSVPPKSIAAAEPESNIVDTPASVKVAPLPRLGFGYGASLVRPSIQVFRDNFESTVIIFMLPSLLLVLGSLLISGGKNNAAYTALGAFLTVIGFIWSILNFFAACSFSVEAVKGKQPKVMPSYRRGLRCAPRLIGLSLLLLPLFILGTALFILPGLIVLRRYFLAYIYIVDQDVGIREAMDMSADQSKPETAAVYGLLAVLLLFLLVASGFSRTVAPYGSILALIVEPLYMFAPVLFYVELQKRALAKATDKV
jgi:hypothetical protein